ncbi:MAG TPA: cobalt ECF transporter T component CbiQ [Pelotomaculum sp.]|nr:cobalt ECF transporter T component CbiQ [Pelotomaculum sp.]
MNEKAKVPEWMLQPSARFPPPEIAARRKIWPRIRSRGYLDKNINDLAVIVREEIFAEAIAKRKGLLQSINPGVKVISIFLLVGVASFLHSIVILLAMNFWILGLAYFSAIDLRSFLKRIWIVVPLFTGLVVLPSIFNFVRPGDPIIILMSFDRQLNLGPWVLPSNLAITHQGVMGALTVILRVSTCVSLAFLLTLTTHWHYILKAVEILRIPQIFITVLEMTYHYIYIFTQSASEIFLARKSRTLGTSNTREQQRFISRTIGALLSKAVNLGEEVHTAMISRGYTGQPRVLVSFRIMALDWLWALFMILSGLIFLWGDRIIV